MFEVINSIDIIFRERPLDYFSEEYDPQVIERARSLLNNDRHDVIIVYCQYDDTMHRTAPFSEEAVKAMENQVRGFVDLAQAVRANWTRSNRAIFFCPDHGAHVDSATGRGTHGQSIPEDMEVVHFFGCRQAMADGPHDSIRT